jgi:hypothetical protein
MPVTLTYDWRTARSFAGAPWDGFDLVSGGELYKISDLAAGSKWFYNWIPDSLIAHMQPEGGTPECPSCLSEGTFFLKAFDDWTISPATLPGTTSSGGSLVPNKMGIQ